MKELLKQALDALLCCSPDSKVSAALQIKTVKDLRAALAHPDPWRDAIDAELVCLHLGTADSFPTAKFALDALINWHIATALDPEVSSAAQALIDRGAAQPQAQPVVYGIRSTCDGSFLEHVAIVGWVTFDQRMAALRSEPWVKAGAAEIVPLYAAPQAQPDHIAVVLDMVPAQAVAEPLTDAQISGAVARGWCHPRNKFKLVDADLALAIAAEVSALIDAHGIKGSAA